MDQERLGEETKMKEPQSPIANGARILQNFLRNYYKALRNPGYGWVIGLGTGFILGVGYAVLFVK